jgi:transposase-like protein
MLESDHDGADSRVEERVVGERNGGAVGRPSSAGVPDPELTVGPKRRSFSAEYKLKILREAEASSEPGEVGALLRREGLYSSLLTEWRRQQKEGSLKALSRARGRKPADPRDGQIAGLRRRLERSEAELERARRVIEVQGNVSALLGDLLEPRGATEDRSTGR